MANFLVKSGIFLTILTVAAACSIVDLDNEDLTNPGNNSSQVDLGSGSIPDDEASFLQMLHNNSSKVWTAKEFTIEGFDNFLNCRLDDTITLNSDGTYSYNGGGNLCGGEDVREKTGNWVIDFSEGLLIIDPNIGSETSAKIVTLETGLVTLTSMYTSTVFGVFDIAGSYQSN
ncbi:MAG: hypothetical protein ABJP45_04695 [Cyclobacteriaceae bacterium]